MRGQRLKSGIGGSRALTEVEVSQRGTACESRQENVGAEGEGELSICLDSR